MPIPIVEKYENEKFYIGLQYQYPDLSAGEIITDAEITVDSEDLALEGDAVINNDTIKQMISGGIRLEVYTVTFKVTTSGGNIFTDYIAVKVIF